VRRFLLLALVVSSCKKTEAPAASQASAPPPAPAPITATGSACPSNGTWAECSVVYRLERAGLAPKVDSLAKASETALSGRHLVLRIGLSAQLELYFYADSAARVADAAKLDRTALVTGTAPQTIKRERTLIESANLIGLLTSINSHQRERVSDALTAGPPQPTQPALVPPAVIRPSKDGGSTR
jgi:hypothetical protein